MQAFAYSNDEWRKNQESSYPCCLLPKEPCSSKLEAAAVALSLLPLARLMLGRAHGVEQSYPLSGSSLDRSR